MTGEARAHGAGLPEMTGSGSLAPLHLPRHSCSTRSRPPASMLTETRSPAGRVGGRAVRLDNVPQSVGVTVLGIATHLAGFPTGFLCGLAAWAVALGIQIVLIAPLPRYDHATLAPLLSHLIGW